ncbi:hypothetical protein SLS58_003111 [Diplodia intermedia]|uniref:CCZ1/INTU/HSP4 first Longin domain-containing protein n=1 Tax=Diplodia intermedia TaxID=856260 RepID=A0ABR3TXR3_9PEZI
MRTVQLHYVFYETYDVTWGARWAFALTHIEACLGAICASVPALKNSLQRLLRVVADLCPLGSSGGGSGSGPGSTQSLQVWHRSAAGGRRGGGGEGGGGGGSKAARRMSKGPFVVFGASEQELVVSRNADDVLRECAAAAAAAAAPRFWTVAGHGEEGLGVELDGYRNGLAAAYGEGWVKK